MTLRAACSRAGLGGPNRAALLASWPTRSGAAPAAHSAELTEARSGDTESVVKVFGRCLAAGAVGCALAALFAAPACAPQPFSPEEIDVIATRRGEGADFEELRTFSMPPYVVDLCEELAEIPPGGLGGAGGAGPLDDLETCEAPDHSLDALVLDQVRAELEALGYEEVEADESPDIAVLIGLVAQADLRVWEGVPWCYAHPLFPGCWEPTYEYQYRLPYGTLLMDFVLPEESESDLTSVFTTVLAGVAIPEADDERMIAAIETAFEQAPYLADGGAP